MRVRFLRDRRACWVVLAIGVVMVSLLGYRAVSMSRGYGAVFRELATGLRDGAAEQLITYHPTTYFRLRRGGSSTSPDFNPFGPHENVLDFHMIQTYAWPEQVPELVRSAYESQPTKPVVLAEGAYEAFSDYPGLPEVTPLMVRQQAYRTYLGGGSHTYGHAGTCCTYTPGWQAVLDSPGTTQLGVLRSVLDTYGWFTWVPASGAVREQRPCNTSAARSSEYRLVAVYFPGSCTVRVDTTGFAAPLRATWIDPRTGVQKAAGLAVPETPFTPPEGFEDALLLLNGTAPPAFGGQEARRLPLAVSANRRHFVDQDGRPFLWVGDTNWPLVAYSPEEADVYFAARRRAGFTVVQTVAIVYPPDEKSSKPRTNYQGEPPLLNDNLATPNEFYFRHLDRLIAQAESHGLVVALLPAWGMHVTRYGLINQDNARAYGRWLGRRYRDARNVVWVLGGDTSVWGYYRQRNTWPLVAKDMFCHSGVTDALCSLLRGGGR